MRYAFGDSDLAARRLKVVSDVFAGSSAAFVRQVVPAEPALAIDLGCGPGYSTHLLADGLPSSRVVGLDRSEPFVVLARQSETERISFRVHDVTSVPFPGAPAGLLYCRFLLTHLPKPREVIARWATQLRSQGLLMIEETDWIDTEVSTFVTYLGIVEALLAERSNRLYIGPVLDGVPDSITLKRRNSSVARLRISNREAATMFFMNIRTWKDQPFVQQHYSAAAIDQLEADLMQLTEDSSGRSGIEWGLRQIVFERT